MAFGNDFYDLIAADYDSMTRFSRRLESEREMLRRWHERYSFNSVLDAACGTGLHAVVLAQLGLKTTGADPARAMLDEAHRHAVEASVDVTFLESDFKSLPSRLADRFEAVLVLGNSLPHVLQQEELHASLEGLAGVLKKGGILVLQLLNYDRILKTKERIVGITRDQNKYFVRFYDFLDGVVQFNILTFSTDEKGISHRLTSTLLKPYRLTDLEQALSAVKLGNIETFGNMNFSPYDPASSPNLVVVARS
ncbi:MAG TPA: class I SAM-dependent methyltransferase [Acidobacteriota bacterium]|nr:class I SAM-dependent methyltransferase [Acidobacteriota bacterium]